MQKHFISISVRLRRKLILHPSILRSFSTISKGKWKESRKFRTIQSIFAINDGKIVGQAEVRVVKNHLKYKHRANIGISIDRDHWGMGIGSSLMKLALHQAKENGLEQMELGVYADNERAIHLYQKYGFEQCGIWKNAFKLKDGTYRDEILMSKIL